MTQKLRQLLAARARGACESCSRAFLDFGEVDHMFGRAKEEENEFNCWVLCRTCHFDKTNNRPSAAHWLQMFFAFCKRYSVGENGYVVWGKKAEQKLEWLRAKGTSGEAA